MNLENLRKAFPVTEKAIFLNHAAISPSPTPVIEECRKWLVHNKMYGDMYFPNLAKILDGIDEDRRIVGKFINARFPEEEIAFTYNTSYGLAAIAEAIKWSKGDKIVINDLEYTSNSYTYQALTKKFDLILEVIPNVKGVLPIEAFEQIIDQSTRLIAISHVQFGNGFRVDLSELGKICHENGAHLLVDAIQSLGAIPLDVQKQDVDYLASGGYKWLLGPLGTGFMFIKRELAESLRPSFVGSMSDANPLDLSHHPHFPARGAKRFQASLGPHTFLLAKAVQFLNDLGIENIFAQIMKLTDQIIEFVEEESSFQLQTPIENKHQRSGIINFSCQNGEKIVDQLRKLSTPIAISYRQGGLRISPHCYNTSEEVQICLETIKSLQKN
ncbi:MAG: aminotransferase class V-fold PLP-dependent enzyme [Candidatus Heimdallarchaeota archaeon]|nr:MAG: aminotransferase class V-fold PLP-dependent enzyme [Candidatus Heimdallarchaeota archaeon]